MTISKFRNLMKSKSIQIALLLAGLTAWLVLPRFARPEPQPQAELNPVRAPLMPEEVRENGKEIYQRQCASCHGANGAGVKNEYPHPLRGALSVEKLTALIEETMPEDHPEQCVGKDAEAVAQYIHSAFYSGANRSGRIQLVRLTEDQFRQTAADLIGSFRGQTLLNELPEGQATGLNATYYHARNFNRKKLVKKRTDSTVDFDFGSKLPDVIPPPKEPQKKKNNLEFDANEFSIQWLGGIKVELTGEYEFIVKSRNGFRLYLNDYRTPAINQWVTSGEPEHRVRLHLLGGRVYPVRLDFFRFKDKTSGIQLCWKPPHQEESVIPEDVLTTKTVPVVGLLKTSFPPDDNSDGYRRGTSVSQQWDEAVTYAAVEIADQMILASRLLTMKRPLTDAQIRKLKLQCLQFVERALVTRLNDDERRFYVDQFFADGVKPIDSLRRVVLLTIKSPRFLYPNLSVLGGQGLKADSVKRRIANYLFDSIPNRQLADATRGKDVHSPDQLKAIIESQMDDVRVRQKIRSFFEYWLLSGEHNEISKDQKQFPEFDQEIANDLWVSLDQFVQTEFWSEPSDFRQLYLSDELYLNQRLKKFYGLGDAKDSNREASPHPERDDFVRIKLDPEQRAGILTHPYLMMQLSYHKNTSPIHRGVFVARSLMGQSLPPAPNDVDPLSESFDPEMTTRQRVEFQTKEVACMSCHSVINPLGFSLENFDAVGRFRSKEKNKLIDSAASLELPSGKKFEIKGPRDLAEFLAGDTNAQKSFVRHLFQHLVKQPVEGFGPQTLESLHKFFVKNDFHMRRLVVEIVKVATLHEFNAPSTRDAK